MAEFSWSGLRKRLIATFTAITGAGVLLILADLTVEYRAALERARAETAMLARLLDEQTRHALSAVDRVMIGLADRASEAGAIEGAASSFARVLDDRLTDFPQISSIWLFDATGQEVVSRRRWTPGSAPVQVADRDYFRHHRDGRDEELYIAPPRRGQSSERWVVPMSRGVWSDDGFLGIVLAAIDIEYLQSVFRAVDPGPHGHVALSRLDGMPIVRLPGMRGSEAASDHGVVDSAITGSPVGTIESRDRNNEKLLVSYRRLGESGLVVSVGYGLDNVLAAWRRTAMAEGIAALLVFGLGVAACQFLLRSLGQQRRIEDLRVESESFARSSEAKTAFLAHMSHELRTPLNAVLGFAQLMQAESFGPLGNARYRDYSGEIVRSGEHLLRLLDEILDLSRIDMARLSLDERGFELARLLADARALALAKAEARNVTIALEDGPAGTLLRGDLRRLTHALASLLENAVRHSPMHETVRLHARREGDGRLVIRILDQGDEISRKDAEDALSPWQRSSSETAIRSEGAGLGLALARSVARLHGGELRFVCGTLEGTVAELALPADRVIATAPDLMQIPGGLLAAERRAAFGSDIAH